MTKTIKDTNNEEICLSQATDNSYSCLCCGDAIKTGDWFAVCEECGGTLCESCAANGSLYDHDCDPDGDM